MKRRTFTLILIFLFSVAIFTPLSASAEVIVENSYYDIDLEENSSNGVWANKASTDMYFGYQPSPSLASPVQTLVDDDDAVSKVMKLHIPKDGDHYAFYVGGYNISPALDLSECVTWYEVSLRFEDVLNGFRLEGNSAIDEFFNTIMLIRGDGEIRIGNDATPGVYNLIVQPNKWYHFVIAVDNIDKVNSKTKIYAWANGTLLKNYESNDYTASIDAAKTASATRCCMQMHRTSSKDTTVYVDNFKWYTSSVSVMDSEYDPNSIFGTATLTSEKLSVLEDKIYIPAGETLSELLSMISASGNIARCVKNGITIPKYMYTTTQAVGTKLFVSVGDGKIGSSSYTVMDGLRLYDAKRSDAVWEIERDSVKSIITSKNEIIANDSLDLKLHFANDTSSVQNGKLVLAAYNGDDLIGYSFTDFNVPVGGTAEDSPIVSEPITLTDVEDLNIKAYIWDMEGKFSQLLGLSLD